jgi:hypothetical protein
MNFDRDKFAEELGSSFTLQVDNHGVDVELVEVSELKERPHQVSFSIVFLMRQSSAIDQGLYDLSHERLGEMQIFLVPIGMDGERLQLEAVFNFLPDDKA